MSNVFRYACKCGQILQYSANVPRNRFSHLYGRSIPLRTTTTSYAYHTPYSRQRKPLPSLELDIYDAVEDEANIFESIGHNVYDQHIFQDLKEAYRERVEEIREEIINGVSNEEVSNEDTKPIKDTRKRKSHRVRQFAMYEHGKQLTTYEEQNVLTELEIFMYLGEYAKATKLFNYHRRCGHLFSIDVYNKMIHVWAAQKGLTSIQMLLFTMQKAGIAPTYQTYAGVLEACGNIGKNAAVHVRSILNEMASRDMNVRELLKEALLTKQQIASIVKALDLANQNFLGKKVDQKKPLETDLHFIQTQIDHELKGHISIKSVAVDKEPSPLILKRSNLYQDIIAAWRKDFVTQMTRIQSNKNKKANLYYTSVTYSSVLSPDELADLVFDYIVPMIATQQQGIQVSYICRVLGQLIHTRFCLKFQEESGVSEKVKNIASKYCSSLHENIDTVMPRVKWKNLSNEFQLLPSETLIPSPWSNKIKTRTSGVVLDVLKKVATIDTSLLLTGKGGTIEDALQHTHEAQRTFQVGVLKLHPAICRLYNSYLSHEGNMSFQADRLPMVVPPQPWHTIKGGAYLLLPSHFVREMNSKNKLYGTSDESGLNQIFDALNYVGNCAWKVNGRLLDIMIDLFNSGGDLKLGIIGSDMMEEELHKKEKCLKVSDPKERKLTKKSYHELFALRMELLYKLSVANHFRDNVLWLPNNLDFRGRIYPIAPHCCHIGNDVSRSMLMFAEGKKLGTKGLSWLKVHLVNVHGQLKKGSLEERIRFADLYMDEIMDSADNPLTGRKWWQNGSDPWQTLIACMEITDAVRSGDPENFVSHLPVQQDGSCNGLQHYAALGCDLYGAKQVNLMPSDRPQDVYSEVAYMVEKNRQNDAENGVLIAQQLEGKINRKVVKQTVMTIVYGVTNIGARLQIQKQLKDLNVGNDIIFDASVYISVELFKCLEEMFVSARQIQDWLTGSAHQIALTGNCVEWVTPLNLLVVQPYYKKTVQSIPTPLQDVIFRPTNDYTQVPSLRKQKGGFAPNFVHSLDSTHMMMTALQCQKEGMVFASVHDSFWTHGCDVDKLNRFCREEFVRLHKLPILEDLKKYFDEKFSGQHLRKPLKDGRTVSEFPELPLRGDFDVNEVMNSVYFFS